MNDYINSFFTSVRDRITSPIFGNFFASWAIWNYKVVYITVFESEKYIFEKHKLTKLEYIVKENNVTCLSGLVLPFLSTAFMIYGYPHLIRLIDNYQEKQKIRRANSLIEINQFKHVPGEEHAELLKNFNTLQDQNNNLVENMKDCGAKLKIAEEGIRELNKKIDGMAPSFHQVFTGKMTCQSSNGDIKQVEIDGYKYFEDGALKFEISRIEYHHSSKQYQFIKRSVANLQKYSKVILNIPSNELSIIEGKEIFGGSDGGRSENTVTYIK